MNFLEKLKRNKHNLFVIILSALIVAAGAVTNVCLSHETVRMENVTEFSVETNKIDNDAMAGQSIINEEIPVVDNTTEGVALYIDDVFVGACENLTDIQTALEVYRTKALEQIEGKNKTAQFIQQISTQNEKFDKDELLSAEELLALLNTNEIVESDYTVLEGDTLQSICSAFDMSEVEFEVLNEKATLKTGDTIRVWEKQPKLSLKITVAQDYVEVIPYETVTVYDDTETTDVSYVSQDGQTGIIAYTDEIVYINGVEISKKNISQKTVSTVKDKEITQGTLEHKVGYATGTFLWPLPSTTLVTSEYGPRWGTTHEGMDISGYNVYGADIIASDGGTVTYSASDNSGYGMNIVIDHGNGFQTHYAHCSTLYVSEGEQVYAGQVIGAVGSTGNSTGPHLHFEIIVNGEKVNPRLYL